MGKKTHGSLLISAIEKNDHEKVHEILVKHVRNKDKIKELCISDVKRLTSDHTDCPLLLTAELPDPSIIKYLVGNHQVDVNFTSSKSDGNKIKIKTPLIIAVKKGLYDTVEEILNLNGNPNIQDHKGRTALHHAIKKADFRMAKLLALKGAHPSVKDAAGNTPLHISSIFGHVELAKMLIHYGGDLYNSGQFGALPIHIAAKEGHVGLLKLFCENGVNSNMKVPCYDGREKAILHVAAEEGHHECVSLLLEMFSADKDMTDSEGETPLTCSVLNEFDPLCMRTKEDFTRTLQVLVKHGCEVDIQNGRGETALHLAVRNNFQKCVEILLNANANSLVEDNNGDKPIDLVDESDKLIMQMLHKNMEHQEIIMNNLYEGKYIAGANSFSKLSMADSRQNVLHPQQPIITQADVSFSQEEDLYAKPDIDQEEEYLQPLSAKTNSISTIPIQRPDNTMQETNNNHFNKPAEADRVVYTKPNVKKQPRGKDSNENIVKTFPQNASSPQLNRIGNPKSESPFATIGKTITFKKLGNESLPSQLRSSMRSARTCSDISTEPEYVETTASELMVKFDKDTLLKKLKKNFASVDNVYSDLSTVNYESLPDAKITGNGIVKYIDLADHGNKVLSQSNELSDSDTFFDDESFDDTVDTLSKSSIEEVNVKNENEAVVSSSHRVPKSGQLNGWLEEQATLLKMRGGLNHVNGLSDNIRQDAECDDKSNIGSGQPGQALTPRKKPVPPPRPTKLTPKVISISLDNNTNRIVQSESNDSDSNVVLSMGSTHNNSSTHNQDSIDINDKIPCVYEDNLNVGHLNVKCFEDIKQKPVPNVRKLNPPTPKKPVSRELNPPTPKKPIPSGLSPPTPKKPIQIELNPPAPKIGKKPVHGALNPPTPQKYVSHELNHPPPNNLVPSEVNATVNRPVPSARKSNTTNIKKIKKKRSVSENRKESVSESPLISENQNNSVSEVHLIPQNQKHSVSEFQRKETTI